MNRFTSLSGKSLFTVLGWIGLILLLLPLSNLSSPETWILWASLATLSIGVVGYAYFQYRGELPGIKNNGVFTNSLSARGVWGWSVGVLLTAFYITLYFYPEWLGYRSEGASVGMVALFDPLSQLLNGQPASQWFLYGTLYTLAILVFGVKFLIKAITNATYGHQCDFSFSLLYHGDAALCFNFGLGFVAEHVACARRRSVARWLSQKSPCKLRFA